MKDTLLVRIRFQFPTLERLDALGTEIRKVTKRRVPRARVVRALIKLGLDTALVPELAESIKTDPVRHGRAKGARRSS